MKRLKFDWKILAAVQNGICVEHNHIARDPGDQYLPKDYQRMLKGLEELQEALRDLKEGDVLEIHKVEAPPQEESETLEGTFSTPFRVDLEKREIWIDEACYPYVTQTNKKGNKTPVYWDEKGRPGIEYTAGSITISRELALRIEDRIK